MTWYRSPQVAYVCSGEMYYLARASDGEVLALEASAALLWDALDGNETEHIVELLGAWVGHDVPLSDVETGLRNFHAAGLIVEEPPRVQ